MAEYVSAGNMIEYTPGKDVAMGEVVAIGTRCGIAAAPIPSGTLGVLAVTGIWDVEKDAAATTFALGAEVKLSSGKAAASGTSTIGYAVAASAATDTTVKVKLLG